MLNFMEVCGTHTEVIAKNNLHQLFGDRIRFISGPGCPVCVIPPSEMDMAIELARSGVVISTFGDMMRVPGSQSSLALERAKGLDIRVVYSPLQSLDIAESMPKRDVVFLGIGFETTAPSVAISMMAAKKRGIKNYAVLAMHRTMPAALRYLLADGVSLQGLLLPGHVCAVIGTTPFDFLTREYGVKAVVSGFEPQDIIESVDILLDLKRPGVKNQYVRAVRSGGNLVAQDYMMKVFEPITAEWRGLGTIPDSGLGIRTDWSAFDAHRRWGDISSTPDAPQFSVCRCGDIMRGKIIPLQCPLFGVFCDPKNPKGPCMVSTEGACAIYYRYSRCS